MFISDILNLKKRSIISIVGAGGKTSLMLNLSEELRPYNKVLSTTTTKIYTPNKTSYDFMCIGEKNCYIYDHLKKNGLYVYGKFINNDNKLIGFSKNFLDEKFKYFDYSILEADGSKKKPIKGWRDDEPVICKNTNKTIGVLDITCINKIINDFNVHRVSYFLKITNGKLGEKISIPMISSLVTHPLGLFKGSLGERILFINKVENQHNIFLSYELIKHLLSISNPFIDKIVIGSLKEKNYKLVSF
ncbi:TPA: putative selenium-dependent hydroxylase accessory protein YqeC [Clostridium botulinum]|uniref:selenium cofactor biosynthesis protein YqeC n=1 Tax=Clostridium botulinum TaxID=1491 RepID=UPI000D0D1233|nr:selenium cofactor biosynthesis protein YqeC [Clostridium botulinum]PSL98084.1 putative selenium-dependent hydroxylase accessory protein YqeC [Clostridium botulinum]HDK7138197.1 putative selenium-dependent hydroxylase accessory protein YqeC [Clostridium botulinum]HDK7141525.1 putative selenium-dependent hydroxylase accessory protein YqeC [Clostridium botulinum]HDK7145348.1 putative selenium-dependent hydroxylase accessory protein YqeC [Clostridium botulinum]HDK7149000.1 putative selenium-dep